MLLQSSASSLPSTVPVCVTPENQAGCAFTNSGSGNGIRNRLGEIRALEDGGLYVRGIAPEAQNLQWREGKLIR